MISSNQAPQEYILEHYKTVKLSPVDISKEDIVHSRSLKYFCCPMHLLDLPLTQEGCLMVNPVVNLNR
jgi:hypothetical protein